MAAIRVIVLLLVFLAPVAGWAQSTSVPSGASFPAECEKAMNKHQASSGGSYTTQVTSGLGITGATFGGAYFKPAAWRPVCPCSPGLWIERMVHCFTSEPNGVIFKAVINFIDGARPYYETIFGAAILAATIIFGYRLATGGVQMIPRESFVLIFKIAGVALFLFYFKDIYTMLIRLIYSLGNLIAQMTAGFGDICGTGGTAGSTTVRTLWAHFDCLFNYMLGIETLIMGVAALIVALIYTGGWAATIAIAIIFVILTLLLAAMRMVFVYVAAILSLSFLMLLGPIFVPLVLFGARVDQFKKWVVMTLSHVFIPLLLYLIMVLVLVMMEYSIFVGPTSVWGMFSGNTTRPHAVQFGVAVPQGSALQKESVTLFKSKLDSSTYSSNPSDPNTSYVPGQGLPQSSAPSGSDTTYEEKMEVTRVDIPQLASNAGKTVAQWMEGVLAVVAGAMILTYISYTLISSAPQIVSKMVSQGVNGQFVTQGQMLGQGGIELAQSALSMLNSKGKAAKAARNVAEGRKGKSARQNLSGAQRSKIVQEVLSQVVDSQTGGMGATAASAAGKAAKSSFGGGGKASRMGGAKGAAKAARKTFTSGSSKGGASSDNASKTGASKDRPAASGSVEASEQASDKLSKEALDALTKNKGGT